MIRHFENIIDPAIWAEFAQLPDLSFSSRNYIETDWKETNVKSWPEIEEWADWNSLKEVIALKRDSHLRVNPYKCDCGAKKTQNPNCHSDWCDTVQRRKVSA